MNKFLPKFTAIVLSAVFCLLNLCTVNCFANEVTLDTAYQKTVENLRSLELTYGSEWDVIGLTRGGYKVDKSYFDSVMVAYNSGKMTEVNHFSKAILAFTAAGKEVPEEFFEKLSSYKAVSGFITYAVYALIALDSNNYDIPQNPDTEDQNTRDKMLNYILSKQMDNGMYGYSKISDVDTTAMVLQSFAPYTDRADVSEAVNKALSALKNEPVTTCESYAQLIAAYDALNITDGLDQAVSGLLDYYTDEGFKRFDGKVNAISTQQAFYAMTAYKRQINGENSLYDMSDAFYDIRYENEKYIVYTPYIDDDTLLIKVFTDSDGKMKSVDTSISLKKGKNIIIADKVMLWDSFNSMQPVCKIRGE